MKFSKVDFIPTVGHRVVEYLGTYVILPDDCNYIATDASGDVFAYERRPTNYISNCEWYGLGRVHFIGNFKLPVENWEETLRSYLNENN